MLSYCEVFTMTGEEGLFNAFLVANCVLNAFLSFTACNCIQHHSNSSPKKNFAGEAFKKIAVESGQV